jgi:hypothetical protein
MSQTLPMPRAYSIVVGIDYSEASTMALQEAVRFAETHERSHIHVVHSIPGMPPLGHGLGSPELVMAAITPGTVPREILAAEMSRSMQSYVEKALTELGTGNSEELADVRWTMPRRPVLQWRSSRGGAPSSLSRMRAAATEVGSSASGREGERRESQLSGETSREGPSLSRLRKLGARAPH